MEVRGHPAVAIIFHLLGTFGRKLAQHFKAPDKTSAAVGFQTPEGHRSDGLRLSPLLSMLASSLTTHGAASPSSCPVPGPCLSAQGLHI